MKKIDQENIWKIVKKVRLSFLSRHKDPTCQMTLLSDIHIRYNIKSLAKELKLNKTTSTTKNISHEILQTAGEMFTYLNYCPPKCFLYIADLVRTKTPKETLLALISIIKTIKNTNEKKITIEVLLGLMDSFNLKEFEKILFSQGHCFTNGILGNCTKNINMKSEDILGF